MDVMESVTVGMSLGQNRHLIAGVDVGVGVVVGAGFVVCACGRGC